jgi:ribosomal protein L11 methyltransferase
MKWIEVTVTTAPSAVEAVANILLESRTGGVEEAHPSPGVVQLRGYLPVGPATDVILAAIRRRVGTLPQFGLEVGAGRIETTVVEDSGWAHAWKNHFRPFPVGRRIWITPTWDDTRPPAGRIVIALDPGMAFGSGLHPSTQMCLQVLEDRLRGGARVFDVGAGSGILSIAAAKLGAASVLAVDVDPVAVNVARQNVAHNGVAGAVEVREGDLLQGTTGRAEMILANLTADIHLDFLPTVVDYLADGGCTVASGIVEDRQLEVESVARASGLRVDEMRREAEWRCLVLTTTEARA